jgi:hypothetical protein
MMIRKREYVDLYANDIGDSLDHLLDNRPCREASRAHMIEECFPENGRGGRTPRVTERIGRDRLLLARLSQYGNAKQHEHFLSFFSFLRGGRCYCALYIGHHTK